MSTDPLDALAERLRDQLLRQAADAETSASADPAAAIRDLVDREAALLGPEARAELVRRVAERSFGLGPLEPLLADPDVDEIVVNGAGEGGHVWVERAGRLEPVTAGFAGEADLRHAIERILAPLGRRVDDAEPLADARLSDGSRVNVVLPPLAVDGPAVTIRRFRPRGFSPSELVAAGTWTEGLHD